MSDPQALAFVELIARVQHAERQFAVARAHWERETQRIALERDQARGLLAAAWNLGHLHASQSGAYPASVQRKIDVEQLLSGALAVVLR